MAGAAAGGRVLVSRGTGSVASFMGGGGRGHRTAVVQVAAHGGAGAAGPGPWGVVAVSLGRERCEWALVPGEARWRRGERESRGRECRSGGEGERCRWREQASPWGVLGHSGAISGASGASGSCGGYYGGGEVLRSPRACRVGVLSRVTWVWRQQWQVVRVLWA